MLRILQQAATAEEVVQDVFLQLWRNAAHYDTARGPFVPWLLTLARNRALDHLRLKSERQRRREATGVLNAFGYERRRDAEILRLFCPSDTAVEGERRA